VKKMMVAMLCCSFASGASADEYTGNELKNICAFYNTSEEMGGVNGGWCLGFVVGVFSTWLVTESMMQTLSNPLPSDMQFCPPKGVTRGQTVLIVKKYLGEHPDQLHLDGASLVVRAMHEAFPCKGPYRLIPPHD
jgi:hypothetical protein